MTSETENRLLAAVSRLEAKQEILIESNGKLRDEIDALKYQASNWKGGLAVLVALGSFAIGGLIAWLKS